MRRRSVEENEQKTVLRNREERSWDVRSAERSEKGDCCVWRRSHREEVDGRALGWRESGRRLRWCESLRDRSGMWFWLVVDCESEARERIEERTREIQVEKRKKKRGRMDGWSGRTGRRGRGQKKKKDGWNKAGTRTATAGSDGKSDGEKVA